MRRDNKDFEGIIGDYFRRKQVVRSEDSKRGTLQGRGEGENQQVVGKDWHWQPQEAVVQGENTVSLWPQKSWSHGMGSPNRSCICKDSPAGRTGPGREGVGRQMP